MKLERRKEPIVIVDSPPTSRTVNVLTRAYHILVVVAAGQTGGDA